MTKYNYASPKDRRAYVNWRKEMKTEWCDVCHTIDRAVVIHRDRYTDAILGLLCRTCLAGLGCFDDNLELLGSAVNYLRRVAYGGPNPET